LARLPRFQPLRTDRAESIFPTPAYTERRTANGARQTYRLTSAMSAFGEPRFPLLRPGRARSGSSRRAPSSARMGRGDHHRGHHRYREGHFGRTYWQAPGWLEPQPTASPHRARRTSRPRLGCQPCANGGPRREEGCLLGYGPDREQPVAPESPPAIGPPAGGVAVTRRPSERLRIWCPPGRTQGESELLPGGKLEFRY
jgi:hypothetical protein